MAASKSASRKGQSKGQLVQRFTLKAERERVVPLGQWWIP
jgi:hypothetical protein